MWPFLRTKCIAGDGKRCLKLWLGCTHKLSVFCRGGRHWFVTLGSIAASGDYPIGQLVLVKSVLVGGLPGSWNTKCWDRFGWKRLRLSGEGGTNHFGWRPPWLGKARLAPFELYPGICHTPEEKHGKPQSVPRVIRPLVAPTLLSYDGQARLPCWASVTTVSRGELQSALGRHKCLPSCQIMGSPASAYFESKLSISALMRSAQTEIPKFSWICLSPTYQSALVSKRRHLDFKTCGQRTSRSDTRNPS
jgi:hypothetical protein